MITLPSSNYPRFLGFSWIQTNAMYRDLIALEFSFTYGGVV